MLLSMRRMCLLLSSNNVFPQTCLSLRMMVLELNEHIFNMVYLLPARVRALRSREVLKAFASARLMALRRLVALWCKVASYVVEQLMRACMLSIPGFSVHSFRKQNREKQHLRRLVAYTWT